MPHDVIPADFITNEALMKTLISKQFGITIHSCRLIGEGFDNSVFLVNEHLVFRFPRRKVAIGLIEHEIRLLVKLSPLFTLAIPKPTYVGLPSALYDAPFYGHELLRGVTGCSVKLSSTQHYELAHDLGLFLQQLHGVDIAALMLNPADLAPVFDRVNKEQMLIWLFERFESIKKSYDVKIFEPKIDEIVADADSYVPKQQAPVLVHGDLYHRHLIFDEKNRLSGIIDWGDSCISDRVVDFSVVYQFLPAKFHATFFASYGQVSDQERAYARFLGLYYAVALLWFGHDRHDRALITTCMESLQIL